MTGHRRWEDVKWEARVKRAGLRVPFIVMITWVCGDCCHGWTVRHAFHPQATYRGVCSMCGRPGEERGRFVATRIHRAGHPVPAMEVRSAPVPSAVDCQDLHGRPGTLPLPAPPSPTPPERGAKQGDHWAGLGE